MLDIGFSEILLTSGIALVVLGPERLPKVARQMGNWIGRARAMARQLSDQLEREVNAEELLREQPKMRAAPPAIPAIQSAAAPPPEPAAAPAHGTQAAADAAVHPGPAPAEGHASPHE